MPHDPELVSETRAWLVKAAQDLAAADHELTASPPLLEDIVFHAQQAAEKSLKAFLTWHSRPFRKTHNLIEHGQSCADIDLSLEPLLRQAAPLTEYAWKFRYPGEPDPPTRREAEMALSTAREVFTAIRARLPREASP